MSVGYVGLGQMGSAMVGRLLEVGVPVTVFDLDPAAVEEAVAAGATAAASGAELAAVADVVSVCVPDAHHVELVVEDLAGGGELELRWLVQGGDGDPIVRVDSDHAGRARATCEEVTR